MTCGRKTMMAKDVDLTTEDLRDSGMVLKVRYSRPLRFRLWVAVFLCRLAARILGIPTDEKEIDD